MAGHRVEEAIDVVRVGSCASHGAQHYPLHELLRAAFLVGVRVEHSCCGTVESLHLVLPGRHPRSPTHESKQAEEEKDWPDADVSISERRTNLSRCLCGADLHVVGEP